MAKPSDEGSESVQQQIEHLRAEVPGPAGSTLKTTIYEQRGVRSLVMEVFEDPNVTALAAMAKNTPWDLFEMFREAADHWLKEEGELGFLEVAALADKAKIGEKDENKKDIDDFMFRVWAAQVGEKHGYLSPASIAANFVSASDYLHRRLGGDMELRQAVYAFADAWHWFHFEAQGEHEIAAFGLKTYAGRAKGPAAVRQQAGRKRQVVKSLYQTFAADPKNARAKANAKMAAGALLKQVNETLAGLKLRPVSEVSLQKMLRPLMTPTEL